MEHQHKKSLNTDSRSKNRIRYSSVRDRAKRTSADVYRSYKRRIGVTTSATREEQVHHPDTPSAGREKKRRKKIFGGDSRGEKKTTLVRGGNKSQKEEFVQHEESDENELESGLESCFASELDLAQDRNASELFGKFYREIWPLTRSLAEMLHHADDIVAILLCYLLSPESDPSASTERDDIAHLLSDSPAPKARVAYVSNLVTTDVLHLIGVLARDFRHEIHRYVHPTIVPRIVYDLLNPPPPPSTESEKRQQLPLDVMVVEAAFRALSYVFRYDSNLLLSSSKDEKSEYGGGGGGDGSNNLEPMRQFYGATLAHRRDYVRRLAAETYAPLVRRLKSDSARAKHIRRVIRALAASAAASGGGTGDSGDWVPKTAVRARLDAIDGVSLLLSRSSCGVPGRLHSKAQIVVSCVLGSLVPRQDGSDVGTKKKDKKRKKNRTSDGSLKPYDQDEQGKRAVVHEVASTYLEMLSNHVREGQNFLLVWNELRRALDSSIGSFISTEVGGDETSMMRNDYMDGMHFVIGLIGQCVECRDGALLENTDEADRLAGVMEKVLDETVYKRLDRKVQSSALHLLCSLLRLKPDHSLFVTRFGRFFPSLVELGGAEAQGDSLDPALVLAKDLLPYLPWRVAKCSLVPAVLAAAAQRSPKDSSLVLLHAIATAKFSSFSVDEEYDEGAEADEDALFWSHHARDCHIGGARLEALLNVCLKDPTELSTTKEDIARVSFATRCLPFLSRIAGGVDDDEDDDIVLNGQTDGSAAARILSWSLAVLKFLGGVDEGLCSSKERKPRSTTTSEAAPLQSLDIIVAKALLLESIATICSSCFTGNYEKSASLEALSDAKGYANDLLFSHPKSIWSVKAASAIVKCLEKIGQQLNDTSNEIFELLSPNLKDQSHFLRLHSLVILNSYPHRPFIVDHDNLDHTDDLDEDVDSFRPGDGNGGGYEAGGSAKSSVSGPCDIMKTLLNIEVMSVTLANERRLTGEISRVEVLCRTGRIPVAYAEAVSNHMLGLFHVKFAPVWPAAVQAIAAVAIAQETCAWPTLSQNLERIMLPETFKADGKMADNTNCLEEGEDVMPLLQIMRHLELCTAWDESSGTNVTLFGERFDSEGEGKVSRHRTTDASIIFENTWKVMESVPQLTARKSKVIVPIFLEFLHYQYYLFHDDEPDARELALQDHIDGDVAEKNERWSREDLGRKSLQKKLTSFLKMFAAINGPQQLHKHKLLFLYFLVTLSNPDEGIAQLALSCLLKFKVDYITPYAELLSSLLKKKQFRDTLTKIDMSKEEGTVDSHHRHDLIPVIVRILFGRFSARGSGAKSSKDSPAARRAAILAFLTVLGKNAGELDYFVYMMTRVFIPKEVDMCLSKKNDQSSVKELFESATMIESDELATIHCQRVEGFLNLLSDVITQLGFGVRGYVPVFMSLLLTICERTESMRKVSSSITAGGNSNDDAERSEEEDANTSAWRERISTIRSLCFQRISDLVVKFASSCDFASYCDRLWGSLKLGIEKLPSSVINAEKPPSLLLLLESFSSHPALIQLLCQNEQSVEAVFNCIATKSRHPVVAVALSFVENLLTEGCTIEDGLLPSTVDGAVGWELVQRHVHLLVRQFTERLESGTPESLHKADPRKESNLAQRELDILCRVSELLVAEKTEEEDVSVLENLSSLLVPFLFFERKAGEFNQRNVLGILERIIPRIGHDVALSHLQTIAKLLGPNKGNPGIADREVRQKIASVITAIARHEEEDGKSKSAVLQNVCKSLARLCASHHKHIEECNFDEVLPVLNGLGGPPEEDGGWAFYVHSKSKADADPRKLTPLVYCCFHFIYDEDGVLSRGALKALKSLVSAAAAIGKNAWLQMIETTFISSVRAGLTSHDANARRAFVLLMAEVSRSFASYDNDNLYGDLSILTRDDDPDLDFFLNVTHVQVHRRGRAFDRLRKLLASSNKCPFSVHSLSNVLLPLAIHPVYEFNGGKAEEAYAVEAVATVGSIAKNLPWGKYQNALWTALTQLSRKRDQERFIIAMICALMDAFHFEVLLDSGSSRGSPSAKDSKSRNDEHVPQEGNAVWRALKKRFIPKIESLLIKEKVERSGSVIKTLRSPIALALVKLHQKLPRHIFEARLPRLLTIACGGLKNRDSSTRIVARETLAKIAASIGVQYLSEVIRELAVALSEGYQLHVRSATLHSVILAVTGVYQRPESRSVDEARQLPFDKCVPAIMDLIQQDIFGSASEIKEAEDVRRRLVKEAGGAKSHETLELMSKHVLFRPSLAAEANHATNIESPPSAVHAIVSPLLERLRDPEVSTSIIGKAKECLNRVILGLSRNDSVTSEEILTFVYASVSPFILGDAMHDKTVVDDDSLGDSDAEEDTAPLLISSTDKGRQRNTRASKEDSEKSATEVVKWHPSATNAPTDEKMALEEKTREKINLRKVLDGANAPKMTGSNRYDAVVSASHSGMNDHAGASAVHFGLGLLHSYMKKSKLNVRDETTLMMADPYVPMLTRCVRDCNDNKVVLLSLKCLGFLLKMDLPSVEVNAEKLGTYVLKLLTESGSVGDTKNEINQNCFRSLTLLLSISRKNDEDSRSPLNEKQMQALVNLLLAALSDSEQNTATFNLIKSIVSRRHVSPEFYDLMEVILKLSVQSQNASVRQQCCQIFMQFLIEYPMGKQRLEDHLKQCILNMKYEYEEGRLSAIGLVGALINKLPSPMIEEHAQLFFLPLVLQLVNDDTKKCRESVAECVSNLLKRLSLDTVQTLYEYVTRWSSGKGSEALPLRRTSAQVFGIMVESRIDFFKRGSTVDDLVETLHASLTQVIDKDDLGTIEWELPYFSLVCLEKISIHFSSTMAPKNELWIAVVKCLIHPHAWVKLTSSRILNIHITNLSPKALVPPEKGSPKSFLVAVPGSLYEIARNLCFQLNAEDSEQAETVTLLAIKSLTWIIDAMNDHPELCFKNDNEDMERLPTRDEENGGDSGRDPVLWLMKRLSNIAKARGYRRREAIFKCFAAFASCCDPSIILPHLELMIEPLNRTLTEISSKAEQSSSRRRSQVDADESELPKEVMQLLEEKCGTEAFLNALAAVKSKAREKRDKRKQDAAAEAVHNPQAAAQRKIRKQEHEKRRKKRRVEEQRAMRGAYAKKQRYHDTLL